MSMGIVEAPQHGPGHRTRERGLDMGCVDTDEHGVDMGMGIGDTASSARCAGVHGRRMALAAGQLRALARADLALDMPCDDGYGNGHGHSHGHG